MKKARAQICHDLADVEEADRLVKEQIFNCPAQNAWGGTPLHYALRWSADRQAIEYLLNEGTDPHRLDALLGFQILAIWFLLVCKSQCTML